MFAQDCARSACHAGAGGAPNRGVTLDGDPAAMRTALLGVSTESTLRYVAPGDPSNSYLQHKIDGDLCAVASTCGGDCLDTMPQAESLLSESDRLVIRRWIAQGAADN